MKSLVFLVLLGLLPLLSSCKSLKPVVDGGSISVDGENIYWSSDDFPLWVFIDDEMDLTHITVAVESCLSWNSELGVQVFEPLIWDYDLPLPYTEGIVGVSIRELGHIRGKNVNGLHRGTFFADSNHRMASMVWFDDDLENEYLEVVMVHELGHALTLAHDPGNPRSVMYPYVASVREPVFIMPEDLDRIRRMVSGDAIRSDVAQTTLRLPWDLTS